MKKIGSFKTVKAVLGSLLFILALSFQSYAQDPCVPTDLEASEITAHSALVSWGTTDDATWVRFAPVGDTTYMYRFAHQNNEKFLHGLLSETEYGWSLNVYCDEEWTGYNVISTFETLPDTGSNCEPTNLEAYNITAHSAEVSWEETTGPTWIRYAPVGDTNYFFRFTHNNSKVLHWLLADTEYEWSLNVFCNGAWTGYNVNSIFETLADTNSIECEPINLTSENITDNSADVSWEEGGDHTWVRYYIIGTQDYMYQFADTNFAHLTELDAETTYVWELNTNCGGCGNWAWTGYIFASEFTTLDTIGGGIIAGVSDGVGISEINLYPNPGNDHLNLTFYSDVEGGYEVNLYDLSGRRVLTKSGIAVDGKTDLYFDTSILEKGTYIVLLRIGKNTSKIKWVKH